MPNNNPTPDDVVIAAECWFCNPYKIVKAHQPLPREPVCGTCRSLLLGFRQWLKDPTNGGNK
jgi:hypothetical protein